MPTASEIIERVKARYAGCRTYQDEGTVTVITTSDSDPEDPLVEHKSFKTAFKKPASVLFAFTSELQSARARRSHRAVWSDRCGLHRWPSSDPSATIPLPSLEGELVMACEEAGRSTLDPFQLLGLTPHMELGFAKDVQDVSTTVVDGCEMFVLASPNADTLVWVRKDSYFVTRMNNHEQWVIQPEKRNDQWLREMLSKPDMKPAERSLVERMLATPPTRVAYERQTTTLWRARMDHDIDPRVFEFVPPG